MDSLFLLGNKSVSLPAGRKLIKAEEYARRVEAQALLNAVDEQVERMEDEAAQACEERKRQGYEDGLVEGKRQMAERLIQNVDRTVDYLSHMEDTMVNVVVEALRSVLGELDERERITALVSNALRYVRDQKKVVLRVCADESPIVQERLDEILRKYPSISLVDVVGDARLDPGSCVMETEMGVVDASLDKQIEILESAFREKLSAEARKR